MRKYQYCHNPVRKLDEGRATCGLLELGPRGIVFLLPCFDDDEWVELT